MKRLAYFLLLLSAPASAQFSSAIEGIVTDASNAAIPDAAVTVKNIATGVVRDSKTSGEGFYRISSLGPGTYNVTVTKQGFVLTTRESVELAVTATIKVDFALAVGGVTERVNVTAEAPLLETEQGRVSGLIEKSQVDDLPISGRNPLNLLALQPGVVGRGLSTGLYSGGGSDTFSGETQPLVYAAGQRFEANSYAMDDTSTNDIARNGDTYLVPSAEALEEVRVVTNNFSAEYGRNPGAQIQMLTKAGTNQFHGVGAYYFTDNHLADRTIFSPSTLTPARKNLFDFAGGGPIIHNRTFFFVSYEGLRQGGSTTSSAVVETPQFVSLVEQNDPNSIAANLLKMFPPVGVPTANFKTIGSPGPNGVWTSANNGIPDEGTVFYTPDVYRNAFQLMVRLDHEIRPGKDKIYGTYFRTHNVTLAGISRPEFNRPQGEWTSFGNINYTHTFSPDKINEFKAGVDQLIGRPDQFNSTCFGQCQPSLLNIPNVSITGGISGFGVGGFPNGWWQTNYDYRDTFSWAHNAHFIKFGGEMRVLHGAAQNTSNYIPSYAFNNLVDFVNANAYTETRLVNPATGVPATVFSQLRINEYAFFMQDDWKVSRRFTLNIGLRYENFGTYHDKENTLRNFIFGSGDTMQQRIANGKVGYVNQWYPCECLNFDPRIGFAWDPTGSSQWTVRGGFGIANDRLSTLPAENYRSDPPTIATAVLGVPYGTPFTYSLGNYTLPNLGYPVDPALQTGLNPQGGIQGARVTIQAVDPNLKTPIIYNWFLGVQHQIARNTIFEVDYIGTGAHHLYNSVNINRFDGDLLTNGQFHGFNPAFAAINFVSSTSNSIYDGVTASVKHQMGGGFMLQGSYTFGKALTDTDSETGTTTWQDAWNRKLERSLANFDTRQRVSINGIWQLPFFAKSDFRPARAVLGGWQLSGVGSIDDGMPINITNSAAYPNGDFNADGQTGGARPNAPVASIQTGGWTRQQYLAGIFQVSNFPIPVLGNDGSLGRNVYRGPGFVQTDLSLAKKFVMMERVTALFRVDAFNALNRVNLSPPVTDLSNANFGKVTATNTARLFQVSLRLSF